MPKLTGQALAHFLRDFRLLLVFAAILLASFAALAQSREVLRSYLFDWRWNLPHALCFAAALLFAAAVFARAAAASSNRWKATRPGSTLGPRAVAHGAALPIILLGAGLVLAGAETRHIGHVACGSWAGIAIGSLIAVASIGFASFTEFGRNVGLMCTQLLAPGRTRALDWLALALLALFLVVPVLPSAWFVGIAQTMGSLPIVVVSLSLIMYGVHRLRTHDWTPDQARWMWRVMVGLAILSLPDSYATGSIIRGLVALAVIAFAALELRDARLNPQRATFGTLAGLGLLVAFGDVRETTTVREHTEAPAKPHHDTLPYIGDAFLEWLEKRPDRAAYGGMADPDPKKQRPYPVYIVAAEGGGLYAAHHAAMVLAQLQDQCPAFAQHVFSIASVSGGSLGGALFAQLASGQQAVIDPQPCQPKPAILKDIARHPATPCAQFPDDSLRHEACRFLARDFLSPLAFLFFVPNIAQRIATLAPSFVRDWPIFGPFAYDRALGLEYGFEVAAADIHGGADFFRSATQETWKPDGRTVPALVLATTRVDTGERYLFAPFRFWPKPKMEPVEGFELGGFDQRTKVMAIEQPGKDFRVSTAVGLSARFPFVTPPGTIEVAARRWLEKQPPSVAAVLVDGGYYENSGLTTALEMALLLKEAADRKLGPGHVTIDVLAIGDAQDKSYFYYRQYIFRDAAGRGLPTSQADIAPNPTDEQPRVGELMGPLYAMTQSRTRRSAEIARLSIAITDSLDKAEKRKGRAINSVSAPAFLPLSSDRMPLPLGWQLTNHTRRRIELRLDKSEVEPLPEQPLPKGSDFALPAPAANLLRQFGEDVWLFPDISWTTAAYNGIRKKLSPVP